MMVFQFLGPVFASVLYVIVFQKAGFRGAILAVAIAPIVGVLLTHLLLRALISGGGAMMLLVPLVAIPISLLPLLILAFKSWPPVAATNTRSET